MDEYLKQMAKQYGVDLDADDTMPLSPLPVTPSATPVSPEEQELQLYKERSEAIAMGMDPELAGAIGLAAIPALKTVDQMIADVPDDLLVNTPGEDVQQQLVPQVPVEAPKEESLWDTITNSAKEGYDDFENRLISGASGFKSGMGGDLIEKVTSPVLEKITDPAVNTLMKLLGSDSTAETQRAEQYQRIARAEEEDPTAKAIGTIMGIMNPLGATAQTTGLVAKGASKLPKALKFLSSTLAGATGAGIYEATQDDASLKSVGTSAAIGGAVGATIQGIGASVKAVANKLGDFTGKQGLGKWINKTFGATISKTSLGKKVNVHKKQTWGKIDDILEKHKNVRVTLSDTKVTKQTFLKLRSEAKRFNDIESEKFYDNIIKRYTKKSMPKTGIAAKAGKYKTANKFVNDNTMVVANTGADGKIYYGKPGDLHGDIERKYSAIVRKNAGLKPGEATWKKVGFAEGKGKTVLTRKEALAKVDTKPSYNVKGELDAGDFRDQSLLKTKAQLTDIWNKTHAAQNVTPKFTPRELATIKTHMYDKSYSFKGDLKTSKGARIWEKKAKYIKELLEKNTEANMKPLMTEYGKAASLSKALAKKTNKSVWTSAKELVPVIALSGGGTAVGGPVGGAIAAGLGTVAPTVPGFTGINAMGEALQDPALQRILTTLVPQLYNNLEGEE